MSGRLEDKVAVVTGGASGIGRAMVELFHREGARVVIADRSGDEKEVAETLGDDALALHVDVTRADDVDVMVRSTISTFGSLHVLCCNAGVDSPVAPVADYPEDEWDRILAVNLKGVFLSMKYAIPAMLESGGGSIINTASIMGLVGAPFWAAYCASKGGVVQLTKGAALEYATQGIRVNAICPGPVDTPMMRQFDALHPGMLEGLKAVVPLQRSAAPEELAAAALFLASDESSFVTGAVLPVDGGYTSH